VKASYCSFINPTTDRHQPQIIIKYTMNAGESQLLLIHQPNHRSSSTTDHHQIHNERR